MTGATAPSPSIIVHAYRRLYRSLLQAVQYARPARFIARDQLRTAFREKGAVYDAEGIKRTVWFLEAAAKERGLEHKILKNLILVKIARNAEAGNWRKTLTLANKKKGPFDDHKATAYDQYEATVAMLNKTAGTLLR